MLFLAAHQDLMLFLAVRQDPMLFLVVHHVHFTSNSRSGICVVTFALGTAE